MRPPNPARRPSAPGIIAVALALALPGCGGGDLLSGANPERAELERGRALWGTLGARRYSLSARYQAGSAASLTLESSVLQGSVLSSSVRVTATGADRDPAELTAAYGTVERMFATIEEAIEDGDETLDVEYDPSRGYPVSITTGTAATNDDRELVELTLNGLTLQD